MNDYEAVANALAAGTQPEQLCQTCPWDRYCITPPTMTKAEVDGHIAESQVKDDAEQQKARAEGRQPGLPMGMLLTSIMFAGKDRSAPICPVIAVRLRTSNGRQIVDSLKQSMQSWDDES